MQNVPDTPLGRMYRAHIGFILKKDMESPEVEKALQTNYDLADALDIHGTPAFIIGNQIVSSAISISSMKQMIADARRK